MELNLSKQSEAWLAAQVAAGSFASAEEIIDTMIADWRIDIENDDMMWAKPLVDEAYAAIERGEVISLEAHEKEVEVHMEKIAPSVSLMAIIEITKPARFDRLEILSDLARKGGIKVADEYAADFREWLKFLTRNPECGSPRPRLKQRARIYVVDPYVAIYDYDPIQDLVRILRIVHGKRRISARLLRGTDQWNA